MLRILTKSDRPPDRESPKEGELFKRIELHGKTFEIRYGFYEERDRLLWLAEPMPRYPDFRTEPQYTDGGYPFVTAIQDICPYFSGSPDVNSTCGDCTAYQHGEELIGVCTCPQNVCNGSPVTK